MDPGAPYLTVARGLVHEPETLKGSRHVATVRTVRDAEDVTRELEAARGRMPKATHHAYAWRLGPPPGTTRSSDDGEPGGTAGAPILDRIVGAELYDVLVVVSRVFGGTKLGAGGLVRAYGGAAGEALGLAGTRELIPTRRVRLVHQWADSGAVAGVLHAFGLHADDGTFSERVELELEVPLARLHGLGRAVRDATGGRARLEAEAQGSSSAGSTASD